MANPLKYLKSKIRLFWARLYIRKDEFHWSLDFDVDAYSFMTHKQKVKYQADLIFRRYMAHVRDDPFFRKEFRQK